MRIPGPPEHWPINPLPFLGVVFALVALFVLIQIRIVTLAFEQLGLGPGAACALLAGSLLGSVINIPVLRIRTERAAPTPVPWLYQGVLRFPVLPHEDMTLVAVNVGGCVVPVAFATFLMLRAPLHAGEVALATCITTAVSFACSRNIPGVGIGMPVLVAPLAAAFVALSHDAPQAPALAYISGTLGVLLGADLLKLWRVARLGAPVLSIGGAGTFDGIFLTGVLAVLLA